MKPVTNESVRARLSHLEGLNARGIGTTVEQQQFELACLRKLLALLEAEPVAWTDEQELRDVEKFGCAYLFTVNPITPNADPRRVIKLFTASPAPLSVPDESAVELLATDLMKRIDKITGERHSVATLSTLRVSIVEACRAVMLNGGGQ